MSSCSSFLPYRAVLLRSPLPSYPAQLPRAWPCAPTRVQMHTSKIRVRAYSASASACVKGCIYLYYIFFSVPCVDIERGRGGLYSRVCERVFMAPRVRRGAGEQYHRLASAVCSQSERLACITKPAFAASLPACLPACLPAAGGDGAGAGGGGPAALCR